MLEQYVKIKISEKTELDGTWERSTHLNMKKHKTKDKKPKEDNATTIQRNRNQKQKTLDNNVHNPIKRSKAIPENCIQHLEAEFKECCSLPMAHWGT